MDRSAIERCQSFIQIQINPPSSRARRSQPGARPFVTISRETGAGGSAFGESVAAYLNGLPDVADVPWTVFDKELVERVLEDHSLPKKLAEFMGEEWRPALSDTVEELLGLHPPSWRMIQQTTETILKLAAMGSCILIGRGSTAITQAFPRAVHVRLVGSLESRMKAVRSELSLTEREARAYVQGQDEARRSYLRKYFKVNVDDPLLYHLVLNTDRLPAQEAARLVGEAVLERCRRAEREAPALLAHAS